MGNKLTEKQKAKLNDEINKNPRPTQAVIAKRVGVSKATVARHARDADGTRMPMRTSVERKDLGGGRARITVKVNDVSIEASSPEELSKKLAEVFGPIRAALEAATKG